MGGNCEFKIDNFDRDIIENSLSIVKLIEEKHENAIAYIYDFLNKKEDKNVIASFLNITKYFYYDCLNFKIKKKIEDFNNYYDLIENITKNNNEKQILNKIMVIFSIENMLEYNMNISLLLDKLVFELGRTNYE